MRRAKCSREKLASERAVLLFIKAVRVRDASRAKLRETLARRVAVAYEDSDVELAVRGLSRLERDHVMLVSV
jgi:hypothetical protein